MTRDEVINSAAYQELLVLIERNTLQHAHTLVWNTLWSVCPDEVHAAHIAHDAYLEAVDSIITKLRQGQ